jgi:hypothetical protein
MCAFCNWALTEQGEDLGLWLVNGGDHLQPDMQRILGSSLSIPVYFTACYPDVPAA